MTRQVRLTAEQYDEWNAKIQAQKRVRGGVVISGNIGKIIRHVQRSPKLPAPSLYKNKWEEIYAYGLVLEHRAGLIKDWGYEVMTLKLAKGKYHRPDFTIWHRDGSIEQAAVKGYHKNLRDSLTIIKWACKEHPWFRFTINRRDGSAWSKELVEV